MNKFLKKLKLSQEDVANNRSALEITGHDVEAFCDALAPGAKTYAYKWRKDLNDGIAKKLRK